MKLLQYCGLGLGAASVVAAQVTFQNSSDTILRVDTGTYGPALEEYHYYYDQWPIGLAISSKGRFFVSYTRGNYSYTVGEAINKTAEVPYPSQDLQLPVSEYNTSFGGIPFGSNNASAFINVQALYITPETSTRPETLWVLDTGRPTITNSDGSVTNVYAQVGGPKIIAISLANDTVYRTYTFPANVHYPDSSINDFRFDFRPNYTNSAEGICYIVDSSNEGRNGFIMLDLANGTSWRMLEQDPSVLRVQNDVPSYQGRPFYQRNPGPMPIGHLQEGLDGIQLSPDGSRVYYSALTSNYLYSIPSANLRAPPSDPLSELAAHANVSSHGQRGGNSNGFEGDTLGRIYQLMPTQNAIYYYDPSDQQTHGIVRDPRIIWPDGATIGADGYFYMNINQLPYQPMWNDGMDLRTHPGAVLRFKIPNNGTKINTLYE